MIIKFLDIIEHSNITSLDPAFAKDQRNIWAVNQLFNGLVQLDDSFTCKTRYCKKLVNF